MRSIIIVLAAALSAPQITQAQGTVTYLSNLPQSSAGSLAVGSDSWLAAVCQTGTNADGYVLDSIQLAMSDAIGSPNGFTVMLYAPAIGSFLPGHSLGTLNGSLSPVAGGVYTYTPASNLTLTPRTPYSIVLTAGTAVANGAYGWSYGGTNSYNPSDGWSTIGGVWSSSNGLTHWIGTGGSFPRFALNATPVPEPGALSLLALGGLLLVWRDRKS